MLKCCNCDKPAKKWFKDTSVCICHDPKCYDKYEKKWKDEEEYADKYPEFS